MDIARHLTAPTEELQVPSVRLRFMKVREVDVVVVGRGPGGEEAAGQLAEAGLSIVGIESHLVGGECPYYGCIPSKMMIRADTEPARHRAGRCRARRERRRSITVDGRRHLADCFDFSSFAAL